MARRTVHSPSPDTDSSKENHDITHSGPSTSQPVVVGKNKGKGRAKDAELEETSDRDAEGDVDDSLHDVDAVEDGSPKGRKRARANTEGASHPRSQTQKAEEVRVQVKTHPRDSTDSFIPGQIVRIQLENFLTYDTANFKCGPYLNMIIGPNGTGKSSIACAIALGLNWSPAILGRAEKIQSFVKNDKENGFIEIELKGLKDQPNLVIRRTLSATAATNTFSLNGRPATGKEVNTKMALLNVQISNLCTFLPQDKVSSFAMMSPQQLLKETQRAAGEPSLMMWHDTLITVGRDHREVLLKIQTEQSDLDQLKHRNSAIENEVQRYNERKKIEEEIDKLNILLPVAQLDEISDRYHIAKAERQRLTEKVRRLEQRNAPARQLYNALTQELEQLGTRRDSKKKAVRDRFSEMQTKWNENSRLKERFDRLAEDIEEVETREKSRQDRIKTLQDDITDLERKLAEPGPSDTAQGLLDELKDNRRRKNILRERASEIDAQVEAAIRDRSGVEHEISNLEANLRQLNTVDGRKMQALYRWDRDCHDTVVWLRNNQDKFQQPILEPPFLSVTVDQRFVDGVESCFGGLSMRTFVAQCREDYDLFNNLVNEKNGALGRQVRVATWFREKEVAERGVAPPPMSREELRELGFDGYALDFVQCPEGLRTYLIAQLQLHRTAIASHQHVDVNRAMDLVSRPTGGSPGGGGSFITGLTLHQVSRSRYGRHAKTNATSNINKARNFVGTNVDNERKEQLETDIRERQQGISVHREEEERLVEQAKALTEDIRVLDREKADLERRNNAVRAYHQNMTALRSRHQRAKDSLERERRAPSAVIERQRLQRQQLNVTKERMALSEQYANLATSVIPIWAESTRLALEYLQAEAKKAALGELCERKEQKYQAALKEWDKAKAEMKAIKAEADEAHGQLRETFENAKEEVKEYGRRMNEMRQRYSEECREAVRKGDPPPPPPENYDGRGVQELEMTLEEMKARLELATKTRPGVVEEYESRKRKIEASEAALEREHSRRESIERTINSTKARWKPALDKLIGSIGEKFSAAFERIGCAGEIRISENEDYDKWAIDIMVKFRDHEKLQLLTGQRQSGGERSLTTILYLMSLTEEAKTPFSLVDEINQGMDQRAERVVHNSMVDVTCKDTAGQYFLITPKLLPDLNYHERMKVLCVANGEWLPDQIEVGNLKQMIESHVAFKRQARASSSH